MRHIPNILSGFRIVLVGVFAWLFLTAKIPHPTNYWWALGVFVLAFLTDVLDGFLARTFHWITPVGKLLDPLADKLMTITALIVIIAAKVQSGGEYGIYLALFLLAASKELLMLIGGLLMLKNRKVAYSDWYGKTAAGIFALGIALTLLSFPVPAVHPWNVAVLSAAVALSYFAMVHYARTQLFVKNAGEPKPEDPEKPEN